MRSQTHESSFAGESDDRLPIPVAPIAFLLMVLGARFIEWRALGGDLLPAALRDTSLSQVTAVMGPVDSANGALWLAFPLLWLGFWALSRSRRVLQLKLVAIGFLE